MKFKLFLIIVIFLCVAALGVRFSEKIFAENSVAEPVTVYLFHSDSCPHCKKERAFLNELNQADPNIKVSEYEISNKENVILLEKTSKVLGINSGYIPITVIGSEYLVGFDSPETTGKEIIALIESQRATPTKDIIKELITNTSSVESNDQKPETTEKTFSVPFWGTIAVSDFSLPVLTIIIAGLDGFNPCAMWVLIFLISLLLGMQNKWRMWVLGSAFIIASAFIYFLFLSAWLNAFLFLSVIPWVRFIIGLFALGAGGYYLYEYHKNKSDICAVTGGAKRQKIFNRLKAVTQEKHFFIALLGIIVLAFAVNLVEAVCSAGLPALYTSVLSMTAMPHWQYYLYLLMYVFIFMLDDLVVFIIAMTTLQITGFNTKYSRYSRLFGGIVLVLLGLALVFKPEIIMFG